MKMTAEQKEEDARIRELLEAHGKNRDNNTPSTIEDIRKFQDQLMEDWRVGAKKAEQEYLECYF